MLAGAPGGLGLGSKAWAGESRPRDGLWLGRETALRPGRWHDIVMSVPGHGEGGCGGEGGWYPASTWDADSGRDTTQLYFRTFFILFLSPLPPGGPGEGPDGHVPKGIWHLGPIPARTLGGRGTPIFIFIKGTAGITILGVIGF